MCHQGDTSAPSGPQSPCFPDRCIQSHNLQAKSVHCESAETVRSEKQARDKILREIMMRMSSMGWGCCVKLIILQSTLPAPESALCNESLHLSEGEWWHTLIKRQREMKRRRMEPVHTEIKQNVQKNCLISFNTKWEILDLLSPKDIFFNHSFKYRLKHS